MLGYLSSQPRCIKTELLKSERMDVLEGVLSGGGLAAAKSHKTREDCRIRLKTSASLKVCVMEGRSHQTRDEYVSLKVCVMVARSDKTRDEYVCLKACMDGNLAAARSDKTKDECVCLKVCVDGNLALARSAAVALSRSSPARAEASRRRSRPSTCVCIRVSE